MQELCVITQDISSQHMGSLAVAVGSLVVAVGSLVVTVDSLVVVCGLSSCGCGLSSRGVWALELWRVGSLVVCGLSSCAAQAPECLGSAVVALRILVPQPEIVTLSLILQCGFLTTGPAGKCLPSTLSSPFLLGFWAEFSPHKEAISV